VQEQLGLPALSTQLPLAPHEYGLPPLQLPPPQVSVWVHASLSLHDSVLLVWTQAPLELHESVVQTLLSLQVVEARQKVQVG
jgi:hypothetical protein